MFRELERQMKDSHFELDKDLQPEGLERNWSHLMMLFQVCYKRSRYRICLKLLIFGSVAYLYLICFRPLFRKQVLTRNLKVKKVCKKGPLS